jgi:drug/metabolite transporter (DMT)-like permease
MPRRHVVLALVVAVCWAVNFVVIDIGLESFPPLLFAALRFGLTAFPAIFFVSRPDVRWRAVVAVGGHRRSSRRAMRRRGDAIEFGPLQQRGVIRLVVTTGDDS